MKSRLHLLKYFLIKDIKARYAGAGLGILWTLILPLFQIFLYWFVFSAVMRIRPYENSHIPYVYYLLSTFFFWLAMSEGIFRSGVVLIENAELVKKVSFPRIILPVSVILSSFLHNMVGVVIMIVIFAFSGILHGQMILMIPVMILQIVFSIGIGLLTAAIIPYIRDIQQIMGQVLQGMFFLSPIIYTLETIPEKFRAIAFLNPITVYIESYHQIIFERQTPNLLYICGMIFISGTFFFAGVKVFRKLNEGFADIL